jgi:hypothetical protein
MGAAKRHARKEWRSDMLSFATLLAIYLLFSCVSMILYMSACIVGKRADDVRLNIVSTPWRRASGNTVGTMILIPFRSVQYRTIQFRGSHYR